MNMKNQTLIAYIFIIMATSLSSCAAIGGIFKAGMGFGIFIVILVVAVIVFLISRAGKNK